MDFLRNRPSTSNTEALNAEVESQVDNITDGSGTAEEKATKIKTLSDVLEEAQKRMNSKTEVPTISEEEANDRVATDAVTNLRDGEGSADDVDSAEALVGDEKLGEIADSHDLPKPNRRMSRAAKQHLIDNGIDPNGEGLDGVTTKAQAVAHVDQQKTQGEAAEASTPGLDAFSEAHMQRWLDRHVGGERWRSWP